MLGRGRPIDQADEAGVFLKEKELLKALYKNEMKKVLQCKFKFILYIFSFLFSNLHIGN